MLVPRETVSLAQKLRWKAGVARVHKNFASNYSTLYLLMALLEAQNFI